MSYPTINRCPRQYFPNTSIYNSSFLVNPIIDLNITTNIIIGEEKKSSQLSYFIHFSFVLLSKGRCFSL